MADDQQDMRVWRPIATFASRTNPDVTYEVFEHTREPGRRFCRCPGWQYRGDCRHLKHLREMPAEVEPVGPLFSPVRTLLMKAGVVQQFTSAQLKTLDDVVGPHIEDPHLIVGPEKRHRRVILE